MFLLIVTCLSGSTWSCLPPFFGSWKFWICSSIAYTELLINPYDPCFVWYHYNFTLQVLMFVRGMVAGFGFVDNVQNPGEEKGNKRMTLIGNVNVWAVVQTIREGCCYWIYQLFNDRDYHWQFLCCGTNLQHYKNSHLPALSNDQDIIKNHIEGQTPQSLTEAMLSVISPELILFFCYADLFWFWLVIVRCWSIRS